MKRRQSIERALFWHWRKYRPAAYALSPGSVVRFKIEHPGWDTGLKIGDTFRIGYYSRIDGLDCVWLVDSTGDYCQTWDQKTLLHSFELISRSTETDPFGRNSPQLGPIDGTMLATMKQSLN
jgi:hypothetical protein